MLFTRNDHETDNHQEKLQEADQIDPDRETRA